MTALATPFPAPAGPETRREAGGRGPALLGVPPQTASPVPNPAGLSSGWIDIAWRWRAAKGQQQKRIWRLCDDAPVWIAEAHDLARQGRGWVANRIEDERVVLVFRPRRGIAL